MTRASVAWRILLPAFVLAAACGDDAPKPWQQEEGYRWRELSVDGSNSGFTHMEGSGSGITFQNTASDSLLLGNRILGQGAGVALGDVDGDGLPDVFLGRTEGCSALYRNKGHWKFEDITKQAGVGACDRNTTGATFADIDGDNDLDLILLSTRGPNAIYVNDGKGTFAERRDLGLDAQGKGGTTLTLADADGDGWLDMYVANYRLYNLDDSLPPQARSFSQMVRQTSPGKYEIVPEWQNDYRIVMRPDMGGLRMTVRGASDELYRNDKGHFVRVATPQRFADTSGKAVEPDESFGLDAKFADLNGDGAPDLYVGNDFEDNDALWFNDGKGNFKAAPWPALRQTSNSSMGIDVADINGDGLPDIFVDDMLAGDSRRHKTQIPTHTAFPKKPGDMETTLQHQRNVLFLNRGDGTFAEVSELAGVPASGWSWGALFTDVDLDGHQDLLIANGHLWDIMDADVQEGLQNRLTDVNYKRLRWLFPKLPLKNVAYRNQGDLTFEEVGAKWNFGREDDVSHTLASADLDGDGDMDVVVNRLGAQALVLRNEASAARVAVRLVGDAPNTRAVGAKVRLVGGATKEQVREVVAGGLYMSHSDYELSFAMGNAASATLEITWRDGRKSVVRDVKPNREYEISQTTAAMQRVDSTRRVAALFEDASAQLAGHRHVENAFDDWDRQFLLPDALSQSGPAAAWFDIDRDGAEDLIIGTGKGGDIAVFHNSGGRLVPTRGKGAASSADIAGVVGLAERAGTRVLAGVSTWEMRSEAEMMAQPAVVGIGTSAGALAQKSEAIVGSHESSTGPIALADYNGDGTVDLFVGSRAMPMRYPMAASSGLFRNVGGKFVLDTENSALLRDVGMVTGAVFADMTGDGRPDLVLARDWGTLMLLVNDGHGRFVTSQLSRGLDSLSSRWIGVSAGDFDNDGRLDIVATSWGRNTVLHPSAERPVELAFGPFGHGGGVEMLLAQMDPRVKAVAPLNSYARVRAAMPGVVTRVTNFAAYADATLDQVLGASATNTHRLTITSLDQMVFFNRGDHFEARALPVEAQFAPAFSPVVSDFNGDGNEDIFLSQNFSPTTVGTPRYDAGRGQVLLGDGKGAFSPMSGQASGIVVYGDQRGAAAADYDRDGRVDLVVTQNASLTRLFHNREARPGLRVRVRGNPDNPDGVGAVIRLEVSGRGMPARVITAGSGYWSQNGAVQVMGAPAVASAVNVRWPDGTETRVQVTAGAREVTVAHP